MKPVKMCFHKTVGETHTKGNPRICLNIWTLLCFPFSFTRINFWFIVYTFWYILSVGKWTLIKIPADFD